MNNVDKSLKISLSDEGDMSLKLKIHKDPAPLKITLFLDPHVKTVSDLVDKVITLVPDLRGSAQTLVCIRASISCP